MKPDDPKPPVGLPPEQEGPPEEGRLYLVEFRGGQIACVDGPHLTPHEVAVAYHIYVAEGLYNPGSHYRMLQVEPVPDISSSDETMRFLLGTVSAERGKVGEA